MTLKSKSIFPACIAHGAINAIREAPLLICLDTYNVLLGPKPSGLIGMTGFLVLGAVILSALHNLINLSIKFDSHPVFFVLYALTDKSNMGIQIYRCQVGKFVHG